MNAETRIDFLYLSEPDMIKAGVTDMAACVDCMEEMFGLLHAGDYRMAGPNNDSHGAMVVFPAESPFPTMPKPTADRRFMAMPAYLGGRFCTTGMKWYGSNIANRQRGLPRSILMFTLNDTETGAPLAHMSANLLSAYRTGAVPGWRAPSCPARLEDRRHPGAGRDGEDDFGRLHGRLSENRHAEGERPR
ncbi:hypothetical protein ACTTAF_07885 [Rhodobacter capsulatus]|uniref:hypothetical protein n=1 Tax=Rhodobacter capsulatus TaxID=1061 RepID=UPI0040385B00